MRGWLLLGVLVLAGCGGAPEAPGVAVTPPEAPPAPWIAFGDSITAAAFAEPLPPPAPRVANEGKPGADSTWAAAAVRDAIARTPDAAGLAIAFGTNDVLKGNDVNSFQIMMGVALDRAKAKGKAVRLARIPWGQAPKLARVPGFNGAIASLEREHGLPPGPDLYAWFQAHPDQLEADGVHPNAAGQAAIRRLWAEALGAGAAPRLGIGP